MRRPDQRLGGVLLCATGLLAGCVYYNAIYNAERRYDEAEGHRRAGRDSLAALAYRDVVRKASDGYRRDPDGEWADEALLLLGRARLRLGELRGSEAALRRAAATASDDLTRLSAQIYLASVLSAAGHAEEATALLSQVLLEREPAVALGEAHLLHARLAFRRGEPATGWVDLDRAVELDPALRVEASLERLGQAVRLGDVERTGDAVGRLLAAPGAASRADTVAALVRAGGARWGAGVAAELLAGADTARWGASERGRMRLERARLLHAAGGDEEPMAVARSVARGFGDMAAEARLLMAGWLLAEAPDLARVEVVAQLLRPSSDHPGVARLLADLDELSRMTAVGLEEPLGLFAAAEIARTRLDAPLLARGLYLAYADGAPHDLWTPKALLAALSVSRAEGDRAWIRGRLDGHGDSPYARAARGEDAPGLAALEAELALRMSGMGAR